MIIIKKVSIRYQYPAVIYFIYLYKNVGQFKLFIITIMYHSLVHMWPRAAKDQCSISDPI